MWSVEYYELENGYKPAYEFINGLSSKMRAKAFKELEILQGMGNQLREPYSKPIQDGIFELRIKLGIDISRVFYFFYVGNKIILTNGFIKKTQKTPKNEIEKAMRYKQDYDRRQSL